MGSSNNGAKDVDASGADKSSGDLTDSALFSEGEKVLAFHGPRIYEAKVQKAELRKKEWRYFVHYLGWNKNWDEWVGMDRLLKNTEQNVLKQQALDTAQGAEKSSKPGRPVQLKLKSPTDAKLDKEDHKNYARKRKKQKPDSGIEKDNVITEKLVKLQIPATLRKQLVDDRDFVTRQEKLVQLPRSPTVDDILTQYLEYRSRKDGMMTDSIGELLKGLRCYFDKSLSLMLLYKKERQQYREKILENVSPSTVYGAEHLLRLFVKLPELLAYVCIEEETLLLMQQKLIGFLKFLQKNQSTFFLADYNNDSAENGETKDD